MQESAFNRMQHYYNKDFKNFLVIIMAKRGRKPNPDKKGYFYDEQEQAVVDYIISNDVNEKNRIYNTILKPAFEKMVESIINRYKLYIPDEEFEDTFHDTISFLMTKIGLYKPNSGYKAYSYCGTICKNYLILKLKNYTKNIKRNENYNDIQPELSDNIRLSYQDTTPQVSQFLTDLISNTAKRIHTILETNKKLSENEKKIGKCLIQILEHWEDMTDDLGSNKFNKSSILLYLKENTSLNTKEIRDSMKKFKMCYFDVKKNMLNDYLF